MFDLWRPQNIRFINREDSDEKGVCYEESKMTWITLHKHLSEQDIIFTSIEETLHQCLAMCNMTEISNIEQEEWFVEMVFWVINDWVLIDEHQE
tara:strand:+ start:290 stop:571 length:282 start_codon:yes stop_codon:yes gene_type:complete